MPDSLLVLASASPARRRLLEQAGISHRVVVSGVEEEGWHEPDPLRLVQALARAKAEAVLRTGLESVVAASPSGERAPATAVLGCDSLFVLDGEIHGKPRDAQEALRRWRRMAGRWGELHTGHCLLSLPLAPVVSPSEEPAPVSAVRQATVTTRVKFADLSDAAIAAYVATGEPLACAGGFALEGRGGALVERIEGCYSNVIGLSLPLLRCWLSS
jgi:septum formation protein